MLAAFTGLAVRLAAVFQITQQIGHHALTGPETLRAKRLDDLPQAAAHPAQRRTGIAADGVLDQRLKRCWQARLMRHRTLAAATAAAQPGSPARMPRTKLFDAAVDGAAGNTGRRRCRTDTAITMCQRLVGRQQPTATLVEEAGRLPIAEPYVSNIDHTLRVTLSRRVASRISAILFLRSRQPLDSFISRRILS